MNYLKALLIMFFMVNLIGLNAQTEIIFGDSMINEKAIATHPMPDGTFWMLGSSNTGTNGGADATLTRLDSLGNVITPLIFMGGTDGDFPNGMIYKNGKLIIVGQTHKVNTNIDGFVIVTDTSGIFESFETYGELDQSEQFYDIKPTQDGGFVVSGFASVPNGNGNDVLLAKFDDRNFFEWSKIHDLGTNDIGMIALENPQGGYILVGDQLQPAGNFNIILIGCDPSGNMLWDTVVVNQYNGGAKQAVIHDDQLIIVGEMGTATSTAFDFYLVRADLQGNLIWQGTIPKTDKSDAAFDLVVKSLNEIYITGYSYNDSTQGTDLIVMQVDSFGIVVNERYYGGSYFDMGIDLQVKDDGYFIISGFTNRRTSDQYYVVYDSFNQINSIWSQKTQQDNFNPVFPNPTSGIINLPEHLKYSQLEIVNELGKTFITKPCQQQINISAFNSGKYWLIFKDENGSTVGSQTIIKK